MQKKVDFVCGLEDSAHYLPDRQVTFSVRKHFGKKLKLGITLESDEIWDQRGGAENFFWTNVSLIATSDNWFSLYCGNFSGSRTTRCITIIIVTIISKSTKCLCILYNVNWSLHRSLHCSISV